VVAVMAAVHPTINDQITRVQLRLLKQVISQSVVQLTPMCDVIHC